MITIHSGSVTIEIEGSAALHVDDEVIVPEDGSEVTIASNDGGGRVTFEHVETDDHELIWHEAMATLGLDTSSQLDSREIEIHVSSAPNCLYRAYRRFEEGWGIGTEAVLGGPSVAPAGTYTVLSVVSRPFG